MRGAVWLKILVLVGALLLTPLRSAYACPS
jgi:hypothetical protein